MKDATVRSLIALADSTPEVKIAPPCGPTDDELLATLFPDDEPFTTADMTDDELRFYGTAPG